MKRNTLDNEFTYLGLLLAVVLLLGFAMSGCAKGPRGDRGQDGAGCTIQPVTGGSLVKCGKSTSAVILDGQDGTDAPAVLSVSEIIDPCGKQASFDEVLLRLSDGSLLVHFSNGSNQFLSLIGPGSYVTTDGTSCHFTVNADGSVSY